MTWVEQQARAMGERDAVRLRNASPMLRSKDAVPALPAPKPVSEQPEVHEPTHPQPQEPSAPRTTYVPEPPPILQFVSGWENAFQSTEVLPYEPVDISSKPLSTEPQVHRPKTVKLGYATRHDAQAVAQDSNLLNWIVRQISRHKTNP